MADDSKPQLEVRLGGALKDELEEVAKVWKAA